MKIKITEPGWIGFTGLFGVHDFVDGVSVEDMSKGDAEHLAGLVRIETMEGENPSIAQRMLDAYGAQATNQTMPTGEEAAAAAQAAIVIYSQDQLAKAADEGGIKAIRAIATPLGLKGTSIAELIGQICAKQGEIEQQRAQAIVVAESEKAAADAAAGTPKE